ncbi:recombinase RecT [Ectopseudomonas mendocina]|uniref:Recombinase RecT n=1 Tax=Ectopseudomonas mendocina TaxID=300 RepID=A0ABZ2RFF4_ECTME
MSNAIATITNDIYGTRDSFAAVLTDQSINFDREAGFAIQAISANDYITKVASNNRQSVVNAIANIAAIGISLNPATKQAYLVPRDGKICLDISYMGLMDLAIASGSIRWAKAELVYATDSFELNGYDNPPAHKYNPFSQDRGEIVGVYVVAKTADGDYLTDTMTLAEVYAIRDRSSAWKAWVKDKKKCPWVTDEGEMIKKTMVKRASKYWPMTPRLEQAIHHLNTDAGEGIDLTGKQAANPDFTASWVEKVNASESAEVLQMVWKQAVESARGAGDKQAYELIKAAVLERQAYLKNNAPIEGVAQ